MITKHLGRYKVYYVGAMVYFNIMNFILLLLNTNKLFNGQIPYWLVVPIGLLIVTLIGILDYKYVLQHQLKHYNRQNDVKMQLNRVEDRLISLEKTLESGLNGKQQRNKNKSN